MYFAARGEPGRLRLVPQGTLEEAPTTEESAHDGAFGHARGFGDFGVAETFDVRQLHRGSELRRELIDRALDRVGAEPIEDGALDVGDALPAIIAELVIEEEFLGVLQGAFLGSALLA